MAKAIDEIITGILLSEAKALVTEHYRAPHLAERLLLRWLAAGKVRCCRYTLYGRKSSGPRPNVSDPNFWKEIELRDGHSMVVLHVDWAESWARRGGPGCYTAYRIELVRADVIKMMPAPTTPVPDARELPIERVKRVLPELYPDGTDGIPTKTVRKKVVERLSDESRRLGVLDPSPDTFDRALGRRRK